MSSIYLHIPFCRSKCLYCSFTSYPALSALHDDYIRAVKREIRSISAQHGERLQPIRTVFVGGGTPTVIPAELLCELIEYTLSHFVVDRQAEITIEANPGTVDPAYLKSLVRVGVNRISFGVQSFSDKELTAIGRTHKAEDAVAAVQSAQDAGFNNINIDLMYGLPTQTVVIWKESLASAMVLDVQHLSLYQLTVEEGTPLYHMVEDKRLVLPDEIQVENMENVTRELCSKNGFKQYEISNFCRANLRCEHNIGYWLNNEYMAAGVAAVSYLAGVREKRVLSVEEYVALTLKNQSVILETEQLGREESFRETVIMGLRMIDGVSLQHLRKRYGIEIAVHYGRVLKDLVDQGFLEVTETHLRITQKGWPISNQIMARLV